MFLQEAITCYHDLLTDELAAASQAQLDEQQQRRGLLYGQQPLSVILRPHFLTPQQYHFLQARVQILMRAFERAYRIAIQDATFRTQFGLLDWEEELIQYDPGFSSPSPTSRLDTFFVPEHSGLQVVEYNADTPATPAFTDVLAEVFSDLPIMREFRRRYDVRALPVRQGVLDVLLDAYQQWAGHREAPRIAIIDWRDVPSSNEFVLFADYFKAQGLECIIADPRDVEYRNGRLMAGDFTITLIYKRVATTELIEHCGLDAPLVRAVRDGAVCMVNSFRGKILHKKASLAVLTDERNAHLFSREEQEAIRAHIPWTCRVTERHTHYHEQLIDLIPYLLEHREDFVLKPNDEYGGKGIVLGWLTDTASWEQAIHTALNKLSVVQERVTIPSERYPALINGHLELITSMQDTNPFVFYGNSMNGCLTRLSTEALLNVSAGTGSMVPTFLVEKR